LMVIGMGARFKAKPSVRLLPIEKIKRKQKR
jgi:hypothetical protein